MVIRLFSICAVKLLPFQISVKFFNRSVNSILSSEGIDIRFIPDHIKLMKFTCHPIPEACYLFAGADAASNSRNHNLRIIGFCIGLFIFSE